MSQPGSSHAKAVQLGKHVLTMTTAAGSGHPSTALALVHIIVELMYRRMRYDLNDPWNAGNDRLVLSLGHAVPIVYAAYADLGGVVGRSKSDARKLTLDDLAALRELNSVLDGHPNPAEGFPFFDAATGSLGQGLSVAAGLAAAAKLDGIDKRIYVIIGDGESREGQIWEAADFIADHRLHQVCAVFSCNGHGQAGRVSQQQSAETIASKLSAFGWSVLLIDGHDPSALAAAFDRIAHNDKPLAIVARTIKGWGVDSMQSSNYHGKPVPSGDLARAISELENTWRKFGAEAASLAGPRPPALPASPKRSVGVKLPPFEEAAKRSGMESAWSKKQMATRAAYGAALVALGDVDARVVALDGDVSNSTFADRFAKAHPQRFLECKIAEQNMISVAAGMAAAGKVPFASSFAKFIARAADQIDMAAISRANIKIVGSHAGVSLGADGPSQMAVSDVAYFRSLTGVKTHSGLPACRVFNPSDAISAYRCCELMANIDGLCYLRTHRPDAPFLYSSDEQFPAGGCKQLRVGKHLTLVGSGYILHNVLAAADRLKTERAIECHVFDAYTLPLDATPILDAARNAGGVILTVEDHYAGGWHAELAESAAVHRDVRVEGMTCGQFPKSARTADEVFAYVGVGTTDIINRAIRLTGR